MLTFYIAGVTGDTVQTSCLWRVGRLDELVHRQPLRRDEIGIMQ